MNTNEIKDKNANGIGNVDVKPCFTTSNALVFTNLHRAAAEKAAKAVGIKANREINQFIINTGMSDDGRTISNDNEKMNAKFRFSEASKNGRFEVGIVLQVNATPLTLTDKDPNEAKNKNKRAIQNAKETIFAGLKEYFKWFCGTDNIKEDELVEFVPDYNGGKVQVRDGEIIGIDDVSQTLGQHGGNSVTIRGKKEIDDSKKLRIGYKVGYTIKYEE